MIAVQSNGYALTPDFGAGADRVVRKYRGRLDEVGKE